MTDLSGLPRDMKLDLMRRVEAARAEARRRRPEGAARPGRKARRKAQKASRRRNR